MGSGGGVDFCQSNEHGVLGFVRYFPSYGMGGRA